jgi:hypothetical protein
MCVGDYHENTIKNGKKLFEEKFTKTSTSTMKITPNRQRKVLFFREEKIPKEPSTVHTVPSAYEKHVSIRSGKQTTYAHLKPKGNAVKDQHRNDTQPTPRLFQLAKDKAPSAFRSPQGKLFPLFQPRVAPTKSLLSRNGRTEGTHINPNKE